MGAAALVGAGAATAALLLAFAGYAAFRRERAAIEAAMNTGRAAIREHLDTLVRRRATLVRVDPYGVHDDERWREDVRHFIDNVIRPRLSNREAGAVRRGAWMAGFFADEIEDRVSSRAAALASAAEDVDGLSPAEFEQHCARALGRAGWSARTTQGSGDQGADVVAEKAGIRLVVQCKLFGRPVGNKAVQEAFAAREHYGAHHAAVVSNAEFTRAARDLAATTDVWLLHHSQLETLDPPVAKRLS